MQLAVDTSTDYVSLALLKEDTVTFELTWRSGQNHTAELLPTLDYLLKQHHIDIKSIDAVIVAQGPGSFNGLRVGISTAKGLAFSLGIPIVGISTLSVEAYPHALPGLPICPIFNAGRGEIATATYQMKSGKWCQVIPERITTLETLYSEITTKTVFCGEFIPTIARELAETLKETAIIPSPSARLRRALYLAELGQKKLKAGAPDDAATLQPIYLRHPAITMPKKK